MIEMDTSAADLNAANASTSKQVKSKTAVESAKPNAGPSKPTECFITMDRSATYDQKQIVYQHARSLATDGFQTKQTDGRLRIGFKSEAQMQLVVTKLQESFGVTNIYTVTGSSKVAKTKSEFSRWVVVGYESAAIDKIDDSFKLGLAEALADQIGTPAREHINVEAFYDTVACVTTKTNETARLVQQAKGNAGRKTGIIFEWIRYGALKFCSNCAGIDCNRDGAACKNKIRCGYCAARHLISACDRKKNRTKKCFRCQRQRKTVGQPHTSLDKTCPALLKRVANCQLSLLFGVSQKQFRNWKSLVTTKRVLRKCDKHKSSKCAQT